MNDFITEDNELIEYEKIEVDEERLKRMIIRIYTAERSNTKTAKYGEREMKDLSRHHLPLVKIELSE